MDVLRSQILSSQSIMIYEKHACPLIIAMIKRSLILSVSTIKNHFNSNNSNSPEAPKMSITDIFMIIVNFC